MLTDTDITNNTALLSSGGGIRTWSAADLTITNCTIDSNRGRYGGGIVLGPDTTAWIEDSLIRSNEALEDGNGGGIRTDAAESLTLVGTKIEGNTAGGTGGGLYVQNTIDGFTLTLTQSEFRNNTAEIFSGGAIRFAGSGEHATALDIDQCLFAGNNAYTRGGAIYITGSQATMTIDNSTLAKNLAWSFGSSIHANNIDAVWVWNSIVTNVGSEDGAAPAFYTPGMTPNVPSSLILGFGPEDGNSSDEPVFVDVDSCDFRLAAGSPGIDDGNNEIVPADAFDLDDDGDTAEALPVDLNGFARFIDDPEAPDDGVPGNGHDEIIDMGAYERRESNCPADLNGDGDVGPFDLALVLGNWGPCAGCPTDLNGDGEVGPFDLALVLGNWGPCL